MQRRDFLKLGGFAATTSLVATVAPMAWGAGSTTAASAGRAPSALPVLSAAQWRRERRWQHTRFGEIAHVERGSGPAALFLHGFPLNGFQWRGALERLAPLRRCLAPDMLGLGYTRVAPGQSVAPAAQVEMLAEWLDALNIEQVDLVANDSGGAVAQLFAVRFPQRVRSLLLTNCDSEIDCPPPALQPVIDLAKEGQFVVQWLAPWLADPVLARSPQGLGGMTFTFPQHPDDDTLDMYLRPLVEQPERTHAYALGLDSNVLAGVEAALRASRMPARILWGTGDTIFAAQAPDYLDSVLGHSRGVRRVDGARLFWPEEFPDLIAEEARALWR
ncbi:alpha/beta fold hydrolase [Pseudoxanthomonas indica]|uniref:Pimeloyl-ACP methyl ester carboxylesterase n=2 Tax=Pseudoxanthomonas indica TaxID=428993 RepID=A0A1T5JXI3_9GAMM|nr:alpha/beta fold hydrolase [Pseudoxanthomonas indica]SKC56091.1 Pimeloyl-ACP methyl ester carboxylesterase [Pseudoxanthomonas indica]